MIGALIGAGASLLGGLFGGGSKKQETTTTSYVDYGRMVREAEAAGFNPLTALRNGGAAGFSVTKGTTPATPLSARIADGFAGATQSFLANFDPFSDKKRELEYSVIEAQLHNLQADTALKISEKNRFGSLPTGSGSSFQRVSRPALSAKAAPDMSGRFYTADVPDLGNTLPNVPGAARPNNNPLASQPPETVRPERINPYPAYLGWERNPWTAGGEAFEGAFGDTEIGSMLNTAAEMGHDVVWNLPNPATPWLPQSKAGRSYRASTMSKVVSDLWNGRTKKMASPPLSGKRPRLRSYQ